MSEEYKYAVIKDRSIHHEGDERSRTHPGHGYPAYTETVHEIQEFKTKEEWLAWIEREEKRDYGKEKYTAIKYQLVNVSTKVIVDIG